MTGISVLSSRLRNSWRGRGVALLIAAVAGCGPSTEVSELPEAAKKSLIRKKVDVQPRPSQPKAPRR